MALSREDFMKKLTSILATMALDVGLISTPVIAQDKGTVGIAMPTKSSARWISDGNSMVDQFTAAGYATDLQYAEDDIPEPAGADREHDHQGGRCPGDRRH
jgi:putative multiple sugar transport system substrate-binding protein